MVEFHPQWLTNPRTARCARMCSCGAQPRYTNPVAFVLSTNPSGKTRE
jgi:hypothetical protein